MTLSTAAVATRDRTYPRMLFARVGWMKFYAGSQPGDERPVDGGKYNQDNEGHERFNFSIVGRRAYGYFQPVATGPNLRRIKAAFGGDRVDDVLIVFVARNVVVGWYNHAIVYAEQPKLTTVLSRHRDGCGYYCEAEAKNVVLLPTRLRTVEVPHGKGGMGQANVGYALNGDGSRRSLPWMDDALDFVDAYDGPNLVEDPLAEAEDDAAEVFERTVAASRGQGFLLTPEARRVVEERAMEKATAYYRDFGYAVERKGKPYDLLCRKNGKTKYVEVKGTQGVASEVILTPNEVRFATEHAAEMSLFVLHSITLSKSGGKLRATGGERSVFEPWKLDAKALRPISYWYTLPTED